MILTNAERYGRDGAISMHLNPDAMSVEARQTAPSLREAAEFALRRLENMTSTEFGLGGDRGIRDALGAALDAEYARQITA